jgi:hypothetical protein
MSILNIDNAPTDAELAARQRQAESKLVLCPDCNQPVSRMAETCPRCGRFFQRLLNSSGIDYVVRVERTGWSMTIAGGVILAGFIVWFVTFALTMLFLIFVVGLASTGPTSQPRPSIYNR